MPIYEYECKSCGVRFDRKQKWSDEPVTACPECSGEVRKVMQPVGIVFKGSGWYKTDNASSGSRKDRAEQEKKDGDKPDAESKPTDKSAKPEPRSEPRSEPKAEPKAEPRAEPKAEPAPAAKATKD